MPGSEKGIGKKERGVPVERLYKFDILRLLPWRLAGNDEIIYLVSFHQSAINLENQLQADLS